MCGIAGVLELKGDLPDARLLAQMAGALRHRGPDGFGTFRDHRVGLAHARLAIIDRRTGTQPITTADQDSWMVFNGEIFNYLELRAELESAGRRFRTASDSEVLLQAYIEWGTDALLRLNGQFAFALWRRGRRELVLARDRTGICPLHYAWTPRHFLFASEIKALFADASLPRELDPEGIDQAFTLWTTVAPVTPFRGIRELAPGTRWSSKSTRKATPRCAS